MGAAGSSDDDARPVMAEVIARLRRGAPELPVVTLSWAQSSKGAIAGPGGVPAALSGTVIADDPQLSVRLVPGPQPQPVILDSRLRFPLDARLLKRVDRSPWIFHAEGSAAAGACGELAARGARLFVVDCTPEGLDLLQVLRTLRAEGITSVMVEGGARVLRAFLSQWLADQVVVTTSPSELTGIQGPPMPGFIRSVEDGYGVDAVTWGIPQ